MLEFLGEVTFAKGRQIDLSPLLKYDRMAGEVAGINPVTAPLFLQEFLAGKDVASELYATALFRGEQAKDRSAARKSVAMIDLAPAVLKEKGVRSNEEFCKQHALTDVEYLEAREEEAYWKAVSSFLENKVFKYVAAHDDVRAMYGKMREASGGLSSIPSTGN